MQEGFGFPGGITEMKELIKNSFFNWKKGSKDETEEFLPMLEIPNKELPHRLAVQQKSPNSMSQLNSLHF